MRGKSLLYGTLAAGITLFVWQAISNVAIPWHAATVKAFTSDAAAVQAIRVVAPTNGVYASPEGILAAVSLTPDMADKTKSMGPNLTKQIVIDLVAALLLCLVVGRIGVGRKRDVAMTLGQSSDSRLARLNLNGSMTYGPRLIRTLPLKSP